MEGSEVGSLTATAAPLTPAKPLPGVQIFGALLGSGFRRYATYQQATIAEAATNTVFGFLRCYVLLAVAGAADLALVRC
jgi:ABC-2 type transport system permease protein